MPSGGANSDHQKGPNQVDETTQGTVQLKIGNKGLKDKFGGYFPRRGSLIPYEYVQAAAIQAALTEVAVKHLAGTIHSPVAALLDRAAPATVLTAAAETMIDAAVRITTLMSGGCLVIQGPLEPERPILRHASSMHFYVPVRR
jgi:hypothetical protein